MPIQITKTISMMHIEMLSKKKATWLFMPIGNQLVEENYLWIKNFWAQLYYFLCCFEVNVWLHENTESLTKNILEH